MAQALDIEQFILENRLDERAQQMLRSENALVQKNVMDRGSLADCSNPSSAVTGRIRDARGAYGGGVAAVVSSAAVTITANDVEQFILENRLDESAAQQLRSEQPTVQQLVFEKGTLADCTNPSSAVLGRIREARNAAKLTAHFSAGRAEASPEEAEMFLTQYAIDENAATKFRNEPPHVQRIVIDRGTLADCTNPSSALMGRLRDAQKDATSLAPMAAMSSLAQATPMVIANEVETFISESAVDDRAAQSLWFEGPAVQRIVLDRGSLSECSNPSSALLGRIREAKMKCQLGSSYGGHGGGGGLKLGGVGGFAAMGGMGGGTLEQFIAQNGIDDRAAQQLRAEPPEVQQAVLARGSLADCANPSSAVLGRLRDARNQGGGGGGGGFVHPGPLVGGGAALGVQFNLQQQVQQQLLGAAGAAVGGTDIETFIAGYRLDDMAARNLRSEPPHVQQVVMEGGPLDNCSNPSSAVMGRIRQAKRGGGVSYGGRAGPY